MKEYMVHVFQITTEGAKLRARAITLADLIGSREAASESLPEENFDLWWHTGLPDIGESIYRGATNKL